MHLAHPGNVDHQQRVQGLVGQLRLEPPVDVQHVLQHHRGVPVAVDGGHAEPVRVFGVLDLQLRGHLLVLVGPPTQHQHQRADEVRPVLVAAGGGLRLLSVRGLDPVPAAVAVLPEPPAVVGCISVLRPAPENHHHAVGRARGTQGRRVVDPHAGALARALAQLLGPGVGGPLDIQYPNVINGHGAGVSAEDNQIWLGKDQGVAVALARGGALGRHHHPRGLVFVVAQVQEEEFVGGEAAAPGRGAALDRHLHVFD